jgi:hypothetical protein
MVRQASGRSFSLNGERRRYDEAQTNPAEKH